MEEYTAVIEINKKREEFGCYCYLLLQNGENLAIKEIQYDKNNQAKNTELKSFSANTNGERRLEMAVSTKPFGYINIWQQNRGVWDHNFTERILLSSEGK